MILNIEVISVVRVCDDLVNCAACSRGRPFLFLSVLCLNLQKKCDPIQIVGNRGVGVTLLQADKIVFVGFEMPNLVLEVLSPGHSVISDH